MGGSGFDQLAQEIIKQKHIMDKLVAENQDLHRQLADLRAGRGIFIEINGQRFALAQNTNNSTSDAPVQEEVIIETAVAMPQQEQTVTNETQNRVEPHVSTVQSSPTLPLPPVATTHHSGSQSKKQTTFLEEVMIDEFASAMTSPLALRKDSKQQKAITETKTQPPVAEEDKEEDKATLRKELMGSFLLD